MRCNKELEQRCLDAQQQRICIWSRSDTECHLFQRHRQSGDLLRVFGRLHANTVYWSCLSRIEQYQHIVRSLSMLHSQWVFCDATAAIMQGIDEATRHMNDVHIVTTRERHVHNYGHILHHYIRDDAYEIVDGVKVTPLDRTIFDCARHQSFPDGLAVIESVLRQGLRTGAQLEIAFQEYAGRHRKHALRAVTCASGRTENGGEAYALGVMLEAKFVMPVVQEEFIDPLGSGRIDRVDFAWHTDTGRLIVAELDGRVKYTDPTMFINGSLSDTIIEEKEREERLRMRANEVVRFSFAEAYRKTPLIMKLERAGVPRSDTPYWEQISVGIG